MPRLCSGLAEAEPWFELRESPCQAGTVSTGWGWGAPGVGVYAL